MKKIDVNQMIVVVANLGVIVGLLLLVLELNQNSKVARAQLRSEYAQILIGQIAPLYNNPDIAEIFIQRGCIETTMGSCDSVDDFRYDLYWRARFRSWENLHYQYREGLYDGAEFAASRDGWRSLLSNPRVAQNWINGRSIYSPEFVAEMNDLLPE